MSNTNREYSTNIIHESLDGKTKFWGQYTLGELFLFLAPVFAWLVVMGLPFVPAGAFLPATGALIASEVLLYALFQIRPRYYRLTEWLMVRLRFATRKEEYTVDEGNQDTRHVTRLKRIMPHGIERVDGAHVGAVEVRPANMALEDGQQWAKAVSSLTDLVNSLEGTTEIFVTTRDVSNQSHIQAHIDRLDDPDVQDLPILRGVLSEWVNRYTDGDSDIEDSTEMQREYYIIVTVTDSDIDDLERESTSLLGYFEDLPGIGRVVSKVAPETFTDAEREHYKAKKLNDRLGNVSRAVDNLYRCRGSAVSPFELAQLTKDFWACESRPHSDWQSTAASRRSATPKGRTTAAPRSTKPSLPRTSPTMPTPMLIRRLTVRANPGKPTTKRTQTQTQTQIPTTSTIWRSWHTTTSRTKRSNTSRRTSTSPDVSTSPSSHRRQ
ncbi:hypothetical protein ACFQL1_23640 [Halomicroarcula sp. GCM10025709]|uniref:hypothetical protein n=1 Tax=Halomicroarcula sp. GCM10025709 TaxID=3252669 RepID=UPI003608CBD4